MTNAVWIVAVAVLVALLAGLALDVVLVLALGGLVRLRQREEEEEEEEEAPAPSHDWGDAERKATAAVLLISHEGEVCARYTDEGGRVVLVLLDPLASPPRWSKPTTPPRPTRCSDDTRRWRWSDVHATGPARCRRPRGRGARAGARRHAHVSPGVSHLLGGRCPRAGHLG